VPLIEKKSGQVIAIVGETVQLMDMETYQTFEIPMPLEDEIKSKLAPGVEVEYWSILGKNKIVRVKS
jgi:translation initiation factor 5A